MALILILWIPPLGLGVVLVRDWVFGGCYIYVYLG